MERRIPYQRPTGLVRMDGERLALRLLDENGVRMATTLRPMTLRDAVTTPRFLRRRPH